MSSEVENRVVSMTFDNSKFRRRMEETIQGLRKLQESLKLTQGVKGMSDVQKSINKIDTSSIKNSMTDVQKSMSGFSAKNVTDGIEGISLKFMAMSTIAVTAISNITTKLAGMISQQAKAFTIAPVMDGFQEYETNMGSIQTILANTDRYGTTLDEVTASLDELNVYSDKTIYNFGEMVKNIGLFTNAGIRIEDATSMIKGFSNAAAASGTTAEGAAGAAYQLSQALSNGTVRLMDWKSLTNVGMGNKNMQQGLIEIADSMGTISSSGTSAQEVTAHFNETLEKGWLSADVMSNYLQIMAGDMSAAEMSALGLSDAQVTWFQRQQKIAEESATKVRTFTQLIGTVKESIGSGWSESFRNIFGDFTEATALFTGLNDAISGAVGRASESRNAMLSAWKAFGGREAMIESFKNAWAGFSSVLKPIAFAFRQIFPKKTAQDLLALSDKIRDFTAKLTISGGTGMKVYRIFRGFFSIIRFGINVVKGIAGVFVTLFKAISGGGNNVGVLSILANIADFFTFITGGPMKTSLKGNPVGKFFDALSFAITKAAGIIQPVVKFILKILGTLANFAGRGIVAAFNGIIAGAKALGKVLSTAFKAVEQILNVLFKRDFVGGGPFSEDSPFIDNLFTFRDTVANTLDRVVNAIQKFVKMAVDSIGPIGNILKTSASSVWGFFKSLYDGVSSGAMTFKDVASAVGEELADFFKSVGAGLVSLGSGVLDALSSVGSAVGDFFGSLFGGKDGKSKVKEQEGNVGGMVGSFHSLRQATTAVREDVEKSQGVWDKFVGMFVWVKDVIVGIKNSIVNTVRDLMGGIGDAIASDNAERVFDASIIGMLTKALLNFSNIAKLADFSREFKRILKSVSNIMDEFAGVLEGYQRKLKADAIKQIAISIAILVGSLFVLSLIDQGKLIKAGTAMLAAFTALTAAIKVLDTVDASGRKIASMGIAMGLMAAALILLSFAVQRFGRMDFDTLKQGMITTVAALTALTLSMTLMGKFMANNGAHLAKAGVAIIAMSISLIFMASAVERMGSIKAGEMAKGLVGIAVAMAILIAAMAAMSKVDMARTGFGMLLFAFSLKSLAKAVTILGSLKLSVLVRGLIALAFALGIVTTAVRLMPRDMASRAIGLAILTAALFVLSGVISILGGMDLGDLAKGLGAITIALGVMALAAYAASAGAAGAGALLIMAFAIRILADVMKDLGGMRWQEIALGIGAIVAALLAIGLTTAVLGVLSPLILLFGLSLAVVGVGMLAFGAGAFLLAKGMELLLEVGKVGFAVFLDSIRMGLKALPEFLRLLVKAVMEAIAEFIAGIGPIIDGLTDVFAKILDALIELTPKFMEFLNELLSGFITLIGERTPDLIEAGFNILNAILDGVSENIDDIAVKAVEIIIGFVEGVTKAIDDNSERIGEAGRGLGKAMLDGIINIFVPEALQEAIGKLVDGMISWFKNLLGIKSPSTVFAGFGMDILNGLINGLESMIGSVINFFAELPGKMIDALGVVLFILFNAGMDIITGLWAGLKDVWKTTKSWFNNKPRELADFFLGALDWLLQAGKDIMNGLWDGLKSVWTEITGWFGTITDLIPFEKGPPSRDAVLLTKNGQLIMGGLWAGLKSGWSKVSTWLNGLDPADEMSNPVSIFAKEANALADELENINPVITPVLDLSNVKMGVDSINGMVASTSISAETSLTGARLISAAETPDNRESISNEQVAQDVTYVQNNYSPKALSTADIYRNTKGQIARAKEELNIAS